MTIYVQMPDTLALNVNSRVRVADVFVGRVRVDRAEELGRDADPGPGARPQAAVQRAGQDRPDQPAGLASTWSWTPPPDPSSQPLKSGDTIPLKNSSAFPTTERVLASIATILRGGGVSNLETIQTEIYNVLNGRAIRSGSS